MSQLEDDDREQYRAIAGGMLCLAETIEELIAGAADDKGTTLLTDTRNWLLDRANVFSPPGEPEEGYPTEGATVISLDAWRALRREA